MTRTRKYKRKSGKHVNKKTRTGRKHKHQNKNKIRKKLTRRHGKNSKHSQRGGYGRGAGPIGYGWKPCPYTWPGVKMNSLGATMSNYYPKNPFGIIVGGPDIAISTRIIPSGRGQMGGKNKKQTKKQTKRQKTNQNGGFKGDMLFQDMVNGVRSVGHVLEGGVKEYQGLESSPDPRPYNDQFSNVNMKGGVLQTPPDILSIYNQQNKETPQI
jgi:hypothetical protein